MEANNSPLVFVLFLAVFVFLVIHSIRSKSLPDEFRRMYAEWRADGCYTDMYGNLRRDVDGLIDAWLELNAMGLGVTRDEISQIAEDAMQEDKV